jgi:hypothetical protein
MQSRLVILALLLALLVVPATALAHEHDSLSTLDCGLCHVGHMAVGVECSEVVLHPGFEVRFVPQPAVVWRTLDPVLSNSASRAPPSFLH